jgi:hypothetical protein
MVGGLGIGDEQNGLGEVRILFNMISFVALGQTGSLPIKTKNTR